MTEYIFLEALLRGGWVKRLEVTDSANSCTKKLVTASFAPSLKVQTQQKSFSGILLIY